jgi:hypothetical protein
MKVDPKLGHAGSQSANLAQRDPLRARRTILALVFGLLPATMHVGCTTAVPAAASEHTVVAQTHARAATPAEDDRVFQATVVHAEQGDVDAMFRLALMYEVGNRSVAQDTGEMLRWLVLASILGNGLASYKLYLYHAQQVSNTGKALKFRELAALQGYYGPP